MFAREFWFFEHSRSIETFLVDLFSLSLSTPPHSISFLHPPPPPKKNQIDIPDPSGGPASLTLRATLPSSGYPSRTPPTAVSLAAPHLSRADAAAVAESLASSSFFVPGAVALFDWVEELRGREELFVVDKGDDDGGGGDGEEEGAAAATAGRRRQGESDDGEEEEEEEEEEQEHDNRPPSPLPLPLPSSGATTSIGTYDTVAAEHSETYEVKKSTFVARCVPVKNSAEAEAGIRLRSDPSARHNCWAFVTPRGDDARCSDDGEPGGTAGRPILASILASSSSSSGGGRGGGGGGNDGAPPDPLPLRGVAVVVSRWKAGPKLGASGLARAYAHAARLALAAAPRVEVEESAVASVAAVPLSDLGKVFGCLERLGATRLGEEEEEEEEEEEVEVEEGEKKGEGEERVPSSSPSPRITISVSLPKRELEALRSAVASATSGRAKVVLKM